MKNKIVSVITIILCATGSCCFAQSINWEGLKTDERHILNLQVGVDYGLIYGLGYSYHFKSRLPMVLSTEYSIPSGSKFLDDFKTKIGANVRLLDFNNIGLSLNVNGIFRRYDNTLVNILNFGANANAIVGYYKPKWFVAGEIGFDKAIVTRFKHKDAYKENFPEVRDGWYEPVTGGNFQYGIQLGYSFNKSDLYLKGGRAVAQDFKTKPTIPLYLQIGYNIKLK